MNEDLEMNRDFLCHRFLLKAPSVAAFVLLLTLMGGCGFSESTKEDWQTIPAISPTARLEYRLDSLQKRIREQVSAMAAENRALTAKNAELEMKLVESAPRRSSEVAATAPVIPPTITPVKGKAVPSKEEATPAPRTTPEYDAAFAIFKKKDFKNAIQEFESLLNGRVEADLADNCHYWIGESYYATKKYPDAIKQFNQVLEDENSDKRADAQLMVGNAYFAMGDKDAARKALNKVIESYPSHARKANAKLARIK
jgi:tol-pal system protein YbgF